MRVCFEWPTGRAVVSALGDSYYVLRSGTLRAQKSNNSRR